PNGTFLVAPLFVAWDKVPLETINQAIDFIHQILEVTYHTFYAHCKLRLDEQGLAFLHENRIAHR
ncbi:hypothetical protein, partial [Klebsiella quasipneumoniae]|uniref:hypothetical protein n=1 Tax=Klebsiella quasipneumoniae TaxID=1463165 RepID=UPI003D36AC5E